MRRYTTVLAIALLFLSCGCGKSAADSSAPDEKPPTLPKEDPAKLPKVAADENAIRTMLRERFGDSIARRLRIEVENKPEGLRVAMTGEVPDDKFRVAIMNEVEARVENIKSEDFNLEVAGPVPMLWSFPAYVHDNEYTYFPPDLSFAATLEGNVYETANARSHISSSCSVESLRNFLTIWR